MDKFHYRRSCIVLLNAGATMANEAFKQVLGQIIQQFRIELSISQEKLALEVPPKTWG
jgi:hypothetical protein